VVEIICESLQPSLKAEVVVVMFDGWGWSVVRGEVRTERVVGESEWAGAMVQYELDVFRGKSGMRSGWVQ